MVPGVQDPTAWVGGICANDGGVPKADGIFEDGDADADTEGNTDALDNGVALLDMDPSVGRELVGLVKSLELESDPEPEKPSPKNGALALHS